MTTEDLGGKLFRGSLWMIGMRWSMRAMGLVSMVVVARLLVPADFGIFAVASTFVGLLLVFADIGADLAIIRLKDPQREHYDTVWTFTVIVSAIIALLIAALAPFAVDIYDDARYQPVLLVLALSTLVGGFGNIGTVDFRRKLDFGKEFRLHVSVQVAGVITTVVLALLLRSYWALVIGSVVRAFISVGLSYALHPYRPRFSLSARDELLSFSLWTMLRSLAMFFAGRADRLIIGAYYAPTLTGLYTVASDLAAMVVFELLHPIGRALFPGLALKHGDKEWEKRNLPKIYNTTATISAAMGLGLAALATPMITLLFGEGFKDAGPFLAILAIQNAISGFTQPVGQYLMIAGRNKQLALLFMIQGAIVVAATWVLASHGAPIMTILYVNLAINALALLRLFYLLRILDSISWRDVVLSWFRPLLAGISMYFCVTGFADAIAAPPLVQVVLGVPLGVATYSAVLFTLWQLMRRPNGIESELFERLSMRRRAR